MTRRLPLGSPLMLLLSGVLALAGCAQSSRSRESPPQQAPHAAAVSGCYRFTMRQVRVPDEGWMSRAVLAVQVDAQNISAAPCPGPSACGVSGRFDVLTLVGHREVAVEWPVGAACPFPEHTPPPVPPGGSTVWASFGWDGRGSWTGTCTPGDCRATREVEPPGAYLIRWTWLDKVVVEHVATTHTGKAARLHG